MKTFRLFLLLLLVPFMASAGSPSFNSFLPTQFTNNGVVIGLNTNYVLTWQMVSTNSFNTNGNNLSINTNTFPTLGVVQDIVNTTSNFLSTNAWTVIGTNVYRLRGRVGIGTATPMSQLTVDTTTGSASPQVVYTNTSTGANHTFFLDSGAVSYTALHPSAASGGFFTIAAGLGSSVALWTRSNNTPNLRFMRFRNQDDRTILERLNDNFSLNNPMFIITNNAAESSFIMHSNGIVEFGAASPGGGITFRMDNTMRQFTVATNAVRVFGLDGITVSPSNNTANGSIDYRISSIGDTNFPHVVITNGVLYGTSLWAASSDSTNYVLTLSTNVERTINMTGNVRVVGVSALAPAGFRGFVGVTVTNNSGSTFTVETTNTFRPYGTNSFSIPSGKDARIVFQIDENRVFYGGTVTP